MLREIDEEPDRRIMECTLCGEITIMAQEHGESHIGCSCEK